jgi:hypothetical protein
MSEDAHFHPWELGFKQSGLRHITRASRGSTINAFTMLHAFPPCCCPLAVSRPGQAGGPEAPPSEPLPSARVIQRRVRRRNFAMWTAFPPSDYYRPSAPPRAISGRRAFPADPPGGRVRGGGCEVVPTFTAFRSSGEAASFAPAASPRLRRSPSPWPPDRQDQSDPGVPAQVSGAHRNPAQIHRVRAGGGLEGLYTAGSSRPPSRLACRTHTVR